MRRCEGYGGTQDRLASKMDEGAGGQEVPRAGRADRLGKRLLKKGGMPVCVCVCGTHVRDSNAFLCTWAVAGH